VPAENIPYVLATRVGFVVIFAVIAMLVRKAHRKHFKAEK
jgi:hypothetical protein